MTATIWRRTTARRRQSAASARHTTRVPQVYAPAGGLGIGVLTAQR